MTDNQDESRLDQNPRSTQDRIDGIVAQTAADLPEESPERIRDVLVQRLQDAGIPGDSVDLDALVARVMRAV